MCKAIFPFKIPPVWIVAGKKIIMVNGITQEGTQDPQRPCLIKKEKCCASQTRELEEHSSRVKDKTFHPVFPPSVAMVTFFTILRHRLDALFVLTN